MHSDNRKGKQGSGAYKMKCSQDLNKKRSRQHSTSAFRFPREPYGLKKRLWHEVKFRFESHKGLRREMCYLAFDHRIVGNCVFFFG
jgi:hypothetical protein